ncbi:hypothetical protein WT05_25020 [Burkholderia stagnalis]|nr:hypothetical protein WT05_25020 [Burkholderia stagnalis]
MIQQRYEGWVTRVSQAPRPRRDLSILARALQAADARTCGWQYDGVQHITPRLGRTCEQPGSLSAETVVSELKRLLAVAPPAWSPVPALESNPQALLDA